MPIACVWRLLHGGDVRRYPLPLSALVTGFRCPEMLSQTTNATYAQLRASMSRLGHSFIISALSQ